MKIRNPRSHIISLRLSEDEYVSLKRLCSISGARSISDLIRDSIQIILDRPKADDVLTLRMDEFRGALKRLERKVDKVVLRLPTE